MNTPGHDHEAGEREREWEVQEHGRRQASDAAAATSPGATGSGSGFSRELFAAVDPSLTPGAAEGAAYRRIAEALRAPPPIELPPDFAARVARIAEARSAAPVVTAEPAFERVLVRVLVALFALCAVVAGLIYGARVFTQLQVAIGVQGVQWVALLAGCLGLSWSFDWLRRHAGHDDDGQRLA